MSTQRGRQNKSRFNPFLALLLVVLAVVGTIVTLEATGKTNIGLANLWGGEVQAAPRGIPVLLSVRSLQPGDQVSVSAVFDPQIQGVRRAYMDLTEEQVAKRGYATGFNEVKGRVLKNAMGSNQPFMISDFLPEGTAPGIVGLVPEGKQLVMLDAKKVQGIDSLGSRNRFDLKVSRPVDDGIEKAAKAALDARPYVSPTDQMTLASISREPERLLLAQNGMIIRRAEKQGSKTVVAVALHPDDVDLVMDALVQDETIYCVGHSGVGEREEREVPRIQPEPVDQIAAYRWLLDSMQKVEVYKGNECTFGIVPVKESPR